MMTLLQFLIICLLLIAPRWGVDLKATHGHLPIYSANISSEIKRRRGFTLKSTFL